MISNIEVSGLARSIIASGYAMRVDLDGVEEEVRLMDRYLTTLEDDMFELEIFLNEKEIKICESHLKRFINLATSPAGSGHPQCLTGINVSFDLKLSNKAWVEAERYKFLNFTTSQSTIHRITKFNLRKSYNKYVDERMILIMEDLKNQYNKAIENREKELAEELYLKLLYSNPAGFEITASMTANYRCLLNIYFQRRNHKLPEWRRLCEQIRKLPLMDKIISIMENNKKIKGDD